MKPIIELPRYGTLGLIKSDYPPFFYNGDLVIVKDDSFSGSLVRATKLNGGCGSYYVVPRYCLEVCK